MIFRFAFLTPPPPFPSLPFFGLRLVRKLIAHLKALLHGGEERVSDIHTGGPSLLSLPPHPPTPPHPGLKPGDFTVYWRRVQVASGGFMLIEWSL